MGVRLGPNETEALLRPDFGRVAGFADPTIATADASAKTILH
jgi:hypothetical protein